ncbi:SRPBCC family protein [Terracidiphilus gabretensis]|uniref:SRPBCC family protein n=1 Tax=Terracidiphilus gabretensis TaxID=1577687 RepID=UPI00071B62EC|nr:SRPBCC family protein [Terracidiphilus gabretensis]
MPDRTVTRAIEDDLEPDAIFAVLTEPRLLPRWAPAFADEVEKIGSDSWQITKNGNKFTMQMATSAPSRAVDYLREVAPGRQGGAYIRVLPRPAGGSVVVMTLPVTGNADAEGVGAVLVEELNSLVDLVKASRSMQ